MSESEFERDSDRLAELVDALTPAEKVDQLRGAPDPRGRATGYLPPHERAGIPSLSLVDGPMGVRSVPATAFPASVALAATWDTDLARAFGRALATEVRAAGHDAVLAPGCNIVRTPACGRGFEYFGEDPHLSARFTVAVVEAIQNAGVMATAKHFVANNQETDRHTVSAEVDERTLRELYLRPFEAAVREAGVSSVMAAYNQVNGVYATEHRRLLSDVLKTEWGFEGFVVSDWWATHDGPAAANAGLDVEMPGMPVYEWHHLDSRLLDAIARLPDERWFPKGRILATLAGLLQPDLVNPTSFRHSEFDEPLQRAVAEGRVAESTLDEKLRRLFGQMARFDLLDGERPAPPTVDRDAHHTLARRIARRGATLLANDGVLPLSDGAEVALVGPDADAAKVGGGGSSAVTPRRTVSPLAGLRDRSRGTVTFARGHEPVGDGSLTHRLSRRLRAPLGSGSPLTDAMDAAEAADVAVVVVRDVATEGADRSLALPDTQDHLVTAVAAVADRTVVVLNTAGPVEMPWLDAVDAVLATWYPGQADGAALADVLYGDADPGGRLPVTVAAADAYPTADPRRYPGVDGRATYDEGVFVGYRWFDADGPDPTFPFGHGHSYTDFAYTEPTATVDAGPTATLAVTVENTGDRPGRTVVQGYLAPRTTPVPRPPKELAAFESVALSPGESRRVGLSFDRRDFARYDPEAGEWTVDAGAYDLLAAASAGDVRCRERVSVP